MVYCLHSCVFIFANLTESFNHLGEAYRYIEYNLSFLLPISVAISYDKILNSATPLFGFVIFSLGYITFRSVYFLVISIRKKSYDKLSVFLEKIDAKGSVVVFPVNMRLGADIVARKTNWKSFWWQPGIISESIY